MADADRTPVGPSRTIGARRFRAGDGPGADETFVPRAGDPVVTPP